MKVRCKTILGLTAPLIALAAPAAGAAPLAPAARAEVDALLGRMASSGCDFGRNGSWHPAVDARTHLLRKLDYLEGRDMVQTTEQFIEMAATGSSMSGQPYQVRCGATVTPSAAWMNSQLKALRSAPKAAPAGASAPAAAKP